MAFRKKLTIFLILSCCLAVYLGVYHHFCDYYAQSCSVCAPEAKQPILFSAEGAAEHVHPVVVVSDLILPEEHVAVPCLSRAPLRGRAPPRIV
ncbi:MAG: hypothetical protein ACYC7J_16415 [Syntrophales bacterium]